MLSVKGLGHKDDEKEDTVWNAGKKVANSSSICDKSRRRTIRHTDIEIKSNQIKLCDWPRVWE